MGLAQTITQRLEATELASADARIDLVMAASLLVCDQLMGRALATIGAFRLEGLVYGQIDVATHCSFRHWLEAIRSARLSWATVSTLAGDARQSVGFAGTALEIAVCVEFPEHPLQARGGAIARPAMIVALLAPTTDAPSWRLGLDYEASFTDPELAELFLGKVRGALHDLLERADDPVSSYQLLSPEELALAIQREQGPALAASDDPSLPNPGSPDGATTLGSEIVERFDQQVLRTPLAQALVWEGGALTYLALQKRSQVIAAHLLSEGVGQGDRVPLFTERSVDTYAAILGILRCGAAYVPLDPAWPVSRIQVLLKEIQATLLVGVAEIGSELLSTLALESPAISWFDPRHLSQDLVWLAPRFELRPTSAYVMFTSGSTGMPKGVVIPQRAVLRLVTNPRYMQLDTHTRMLQAAPFGFDASTLELWGPLLNGGCCVLHRELIPSARGLAKTISELQVNTAWLTSALFNNVVDGGVKHLQGLKQLLIGGEALSVTQVRRALAELPELRLINGYGPTESTTFACTYDIPRDLPEDAKSVPIGFPITATMTRVLNHRFERIPQGFAGELLIGGLGLSEGYLGNPSLSAARFVNLESGTRFYRSGDRVRMLEGGALEFLGRNDQQIKLSGYRIELSEIESLIAALPGVGAAAAMVRHEQDAQGQLTAYVVADPQAYQPTAWRRHLLAQLPQAMVPSAWVRLNTLPLTANGKLDRSALPIPSGQRPDTGASFEPPSNPVEAAIAAVFEKVLHIKPIGALDHFFEYGGSSLAVVRAISLLEEQLGRVIPVASFFGNPTPRGIAGLLSQGVTDEGTPSKTPRSTGEAMLNEPIAIVGMALRMPGADTLEAFWNNLEAGRDSITRFSLEAIDPSVSLQLKADKDYVAARGVIRDVAGFDAEFFGISPAEAELMDPQQRVFLEICWECMEHAGYAAGADYWSTVQAGAVGVFAGVYNASYFQNHVLSHPDKVADFGAFQVMLANEKDYVATRVAHRLNLTGPAVNVFTACSTSLVAIAQAVDSLRLGRCDAALAGGASITCPPNSGYLYQEGSMLSPDGLTRSFDASAAGTVFSDGAAVVFLKRLSDAVAHGDTIHAVLRGVAVNNDGGAKASFTAPSVDGQVRVIVAAHREAGVTGQDIDYVEAHGTATPMGDPIEVDALRRAFALSAPPMSGLNPHRVSDEKCFIGSVKSNVGHTVMAAGAAGVIKTALALAHQKLPKSLHYHAPNPALDLGNSPFEVLAEARPWARSTRTRLAGVSSFGVGGTNAHVILQEAPELVRTPDLGQAQILSLSARTPSALQVAATQLREYLAARPDTPLQDIAFTLEHGRKHFVHRLALVAQDQADALAQLTADKLPVESFGKQRAPFKSTVLMFPGQGAQYARMGWQLYQSDEPFRAAMEQCFKVLQARLALDLKAHLFGVGDAATMPGALTETYLTQPALFAIEYALAQSWIARGLQPTALLGHSVGEFVAATLAEVMSLEDAVYLVARRGALMQSMPAGRMLAVRQSADALIAELPEHVSLAVENSPNSVVLAGPESAIEDYRVLLEARGISARLLDTSHAFHSAMMEPAVALFEQELQAVKLRPPSLPIMSTVTARWLSDAEAVQTSYWAQHLRLPVRFSSAVSALLETLDGLFVEIGPRATLTQLVRQQLKPAHASVAINTLADQVEEESLSGLRARARLWTLGVKLLGPSDANQPPQGRRIPLPTYPFERRHFWLNTLSLASPHTSSEHTVTDTPSTSGQRRSQIIQDLGQLFESVSGVDFSQADPQQSFAELGLDSLVLTQVALQIKRRFSIKVSFRELMESYRSIDALSEHLERSLPPEINVRLAAPVNPPSQLAPANHASVASLAPTSGGVDLSAATPLSVAGDASLTQVLQQQLLLMQQQLELIRFGASWRATPSSVDSGAASHLVTAATSAAESDQHQPASPSEAGESQTYDVKKAFGAIARIHTNRSAELTARQRARLDALITRYVARTKASKAYTARQRGHLADPRVVNGFRPALKEIIYQIVIEKSSGAYLWDLDGNRYVDALNGFGMSLFGWQPPFVTEALRQQLELGYEIGPQHPLAGEVAQQICDMTGFERAAFCNTGSEAVMGAIRIARTVTGRPLIVSFAGAYHGIFDEVVVRGTKSLRTIPAAPGIMANVGENVLVLEYGSEEALRIIAERSEDIAAVLVEPVQSRRPDFQPKEFLKSLRALTERTGIALVFDEVVTGFRAHPGGVQSLFGVRADMATYGKVIGGGLSIGVVAGKREYLDALDGGHWQFGDDSIPTVGVTYFAGTFVRHPLALAAAKAVLKHMKEQGPSLQENLNARTQQLCEAMNAFCKARGAPIEIRHFSSVWKIVFLEEHPYQDLLFAMMRSRGVHILDNFPCFMTTAHQSDDLSVVLEAFKDSVIELQEATFLPGRQDDALNTLDANHPPLPGARLGRNRTGQVAWFIESPAQSGKYVEMT